MYNALYEEKKIYLFIYFDEKTTNRQVKKILDTNNVMRNQISLQTLHCNNLQQQNVTQLH